MEQQWPNTVMMMTVPVYANMWKLFSKSVCEEERGGTRTEGRTGQWGRAEFVLWTEECDNR